MEKQILNCRRSRAKLEINTHGGRVTGWHNTLPIVYAIPPAGGELWAVNEVAECSCGARQMARTSYIGGCTVIWS